MMIWNVQDIHHQLIVSVSIHSKCHLIKHPDACIGVMHLSAVLGLGRVAVIAVHISQKVYMYYHMKQ